MKYLVLLFALSGCAAVPTIIRIAAATGRLICQAEGCPCTSGGLMVSPASRPVAFDIYPDGGVVAVYR